jgi:hypothetical protein
MVLRLLRSRTGASPLATGFHFIQLAEVEHTRRIASHALTVTIRRAALTVSQPQVYRIRLLQAPVPVADT